MKHFTVARHSVKRQQGVAAVEFAILAPLLLVLLSAPLFIGRVLWHYTVVQKAAHDAARYLATVPEVESRTVGLAPHTLDTARDIVAAELADLNSDALDPEVTVDCNNGLNCSATTPWSSVRVAIEVNVIDPFFKVPLAGWDGLPIKANVRMRYVGTK